MPKPSTSLRAAGDLKNPAIAEYTCDETWGDKAGQVLVGDVIAPPGKSYADVRWRDSGRIERIRFRDAPGIVFKPAPPA